MTYIEPLILYVVLFLSGSLDRAPVVKDAVFSLSGELIRIFLYNIPSLALIWYLLLKNKNLKKWGIGLPGRRDLLPGFLALPALMFIGFIIAFISPYFSEFPKTPDIVPPSTIPGWIVLAVSCISTGYQEESFFRFYLLSKRERLGLSNSGAVLLSTLMFSLCHIYEGPWGFVNAVFSAVMLSFVFLRYQSLHGIALAHGLYNIFVYALSSLWNR
jgi:membrane protease YdiL (CAAX protease family)